ncbi:MAG: hypothetical protein OSA51_07970 [Octadecabacter sp.]|nr:hypothetical protein [Octadecabacter sp.]
MALAKLNEIDVARLEDIRIGKDYVIFTEFQQDCLTTYRENNLTFITMTLCQNG